MMPHPDEEPYHLPEPPRWIRRVRIRNYKSIRHADVSLSPFTILVGRNGSGKINFLDALHFVSDSLQLSLATAVRSRGGWTAVRRRMEAGSSGSLSILLDLVLPGGRTAEYQFVLMPRSAGFIIRRELLTIWLPGQEFPIEYFEVRNGRLESSSIAGLPDADDDRLYLAKASGFQPFREIYAALVLMGFYNFNPQIMRAAQTPDASGVLHSDGGNVTSVLKHLRTRRPQQMERILSYLEAIVPEIVDVRVSSAGPHQVLVFHQAIPGQSAPVKFHATSISDGTLRAMGILTALFQVPRQKQLLTFVGIEEPETALHPAASRALMDALREASTQTQVVVTTHGADLLDQSEAEEESLLAALSQDGTTRIAPLNKASRDAIHRHLFTPGELLRLDQLEPDPKDLDRQEVRGQEDDEQTAGRSNRRRTR